MKYLFCLLVLFSCLYSVHSYSVCEIIQSWHYPCEEHTAETEDGWELSVQHIPGNASLGVVFFQHGLVDSAAGICLNPPNEGLPYILHDKGFDVWLGNNRGNGISMTNKYYTPDQTEFWDFSWDEMAKYDMPAQIDYVLGQTGVQNLTYIGHSEGTIQAFAGLVSQPDLHEKLNLYVALAPVAYVGNQRAKLLEVLALLDVDKIFALLGEKEFALPIAIEKLLPDICHIDPKLCEFELNLVMGPSTYLNQTRMGYYMKYEPNPTSVKNMAHWAQGVRDKNFQMFDYGTEGNLQHYNQTTPPQYELEYFPSSLKTSLFTGGEDYLADPKDVAILLSQLPFQPYVHNEPNYAHMDPLWSVNAYQRIYPLIVQQIIAVQQKQ